MQKHQATILFMTKIDENGMWHYKGLNQSFSQNNTLFVFMLLNVVHKDINHAKWVKKNHTHSQEVLTIT